MADGEAIVLSYKDSLLRKSDIDLLKRGAWLNDALLSFWFEYVVGEMYPSAQNLVTLVGPEVCQLLKLAPDSDFPSLLSSVQNARFVLMALNNQSNPDAPGGSHWSLLAYDTLSPDLPVIHLDSSRGCNREAASIFAQRLKRDLEEPVVPQQENTSDCALYVMLFAEMLCRAIGRAAQDPTTEIYLFPLPEELSFISPECASNKREELRELIMTMANIKNSGVKTTL